MTPKQRKFCDEYIKTGNATQSAINAGYSKKTAKSIGAENLTKPDLKKYIDSKLKDISNNAIATAEETLSILTKIVRGEHTEQVITAEGDVIDKHPDTNQVIRASSEILKRYPLAQDININGNLSVSNPFENLTEEELRILASRDEG
ncbi:terminase small subunit [Lactococcus lactis]|uniref:terminase small subunit n=1 Tax=Lactococcus lactis TaxID=1358 RepID=UPI00288F045C|nr:terminase small subunit [Lactococcus lactis]MDT2861765.1 terminase small subunit [Lactococcus lactis]MDT2870149.1 terminase small subunit [Lactococcus lactis]MDT2891793.1 terminase small subunit [Lactococcus lactis]MDT2913075.1 terminase small subunit [Lactococcus lactis]